VAFSLRKPITAWLAPKRRRQEQQVQMHRQQALAPGQQRALQQVLPLPSYRKQPGRRQRSLRPKREICSCSKY
jgi:hypothetical protein